MSCLVEMKNVSKKFPGVLALDNVCFELKSGEVHALLGENGAGKSTLMKILSGIYEPSGGSIILGEQAFEKLTPTDSANNKIGIIYQELSVIDELSIGENLFIGRLPSKKELLWNAVDYRKLTEMSKGLLEIVGLKRHPSVFVKELSISEKQQVEIAKALSQDADILIMDEPTSSLTDEETSKLFNTIKKLTASGKGVVYISHKMHEIKMIADRVTVLKDGKTVGTRDVADVTADELISMMVGRELSVLYPSKKYKQIEKKPLLQVENLTRKDKKVRDITFCLNQGEILGFAGLVGAGRTELMRAIFGADRVSAGKVYLKGKPSTSNNPYSSIKSGLAMVTESRRDSGFFSNFQVWKNISIVPLIKKSKLQGVWGHTNTSFERKLAEDKRVSLKIKCSSIDQSVVELSGGNQQKVILAKWLAGDSEIFILDEPTRGIDIGAKGEIYRLMRQLVESGKGVIMVSSELPELIGMCDRILVFGDGRIRGEVSAENANEERILQLAMLGEQNNG